MGEVDPVSAYRATECQRPEVALAGYEADYGLVMISETLITECNLQIVDKPDPKGPPGHVVLVGRKPRSVISRLAKEALWVVECPDTQGLASKSG